MQINLTSACYQKPKIQDLEYKECASQHAVQTSLDSCKPHEQDNLKTLPPFHRID